MTNFWLKAALNVQTENDNGELRKQTFTNVNQGVTAEQIAIFSKVLETLTGNSLFLINLADTTEYTRAAAE
ncbi:DUF1659 domain-containing protein [Lactiplantibacillus modestisalitolerans]|uniref:DUF1659 domain-containing protein n=1 Tax=Lactiplantibacillus modestisalitolerans TaxID=1457219 RepID=A0ABV5WUC6_9LACO|nr:hypothetical protein [Lactiplantibacillus modestisalitolerans]